ncbi:MAG: RluA family pseudouridine synthase [Peptococcaceae bacterium]|nr:RluA family pseudouridine synthase [Peptococcaceae bacterium]
MFSDTIFTYVLKKEDEGKKLEEILYRHFHFSRKLIQKIKIGENAWLDGEFVFLNTRGKAGQTLTVNIMGEELSTIEGENNPIHILYEDDLFLAVNKPPGQTVHPNSRYPFGTLANSVVGYWESKNESRPFRPISRIDRNTSGIVLIAKTRFAHQQLAWQAGKNLLGKRYLGIVEGQFFPDQGEFSSPIALQAGSKIIREISPKGQPAKTLFKVLQRFNDYSFMEFTLLTGRTHQIRVHCQGSGHPLLGDDLYGGNMSYIQRQALHCASYSFTHPLKQVRIHIEAPLPDDLRMLVH